MKRGTPRHKKMYALAEALKIPLPYAVGLMEMLWHFTGTNRPQGDIGSVPDAEIAMAVGWPKKPTLLIDALCSEAVRFVEKDTEHRLIVHDWPDHAEYEVCRSLERSKKDFLPVYGKSTRDRRASGAPTARDFREIGAPSREAKAKAIGLGSSETQTTNSEKTSSRASDPFSEAGWESPEHFEAWWADVVRKHPNRNRNAVAKTKAIELILEGVLSRSAWEEGYERLMEAEGDSWQGGFAPNLWQMLDDRAWLHPPRPIRKRELTVEERIAAS